MKDKLSEFNSSTSKLILLYVNTTGITDPIQIAQDLDLSVLTVYSLLDIVPQQPEKNINICPKTLEKTQTGTPR